MDNNRQVITIKGHLVHAIITEEGIPWYAVIYSGDSKREKLLTLKEAMRSPVTPKEVITFIKKKFPEEYWK